MNRAGSLLLLGKLAAAKATYAKALGFARRLNLRTAVLNVRYGLASIDLKQGQFLRALNSFQKVAESAKEQGLKQGVLIAELRIAECLGRLGHREDMLTRVRALRGSLEGLSVAFDPPVRDLLALADDDNLSSELVAHVVAYFEARERGVQTRYRPLKLVVNGS
jgi:tetratricopeptide (TPR) repeat protein